MATNREYVQSILSTLALAQNAEDAVLEDAGEIREILKEMDDLADDLREHLEPKRGPGDGGF